MFHMECVCVCVCNEANTKHYKATWRVSVLLPQRDAAQQLHRWYSGDTAVGLFYNEHDLKKKVRRSDLRQYFEGIIYHI